MSLLSRTEAATKWTSLLGTRWLCWCPGGNVTKWLCYNEGEMQRDAAAWQWRSDTDNAGDGGIKLGHHSPPSAHTPRPSAGYENSDINSSRHPDDGFHFLYQNTKISISHFHSTSSFVIYPTYTNTFVRYFGDIKFGLLLWAKQGKHTKPKAHLSLDGISHLSGCCVSVYGWWLEVLNFDINLHYVPTSAFSLFKASTVSISRLKT